MDERWVAEELRLWNVMQSPIRKRLTMHSLDPEHRKKVIMEIDKHKAQEFSRGWENYRNWVKH